MKCTFILLLAACLQVSANGNAQSISVEFREMRFEKALKEIAKKSGYQVFYQQSQIKQAKSVSIIKANTDVREVLNELFKEQPLKYEIANKTIVVSPKEEKRPSVVTKGFNSELNLVQVLPLIEISGKVTDENGNPLLGASIMVKGTKTGTQTNAEGLFTISAVDEKVLIEVSYVGFEKMEFTANSIRIIKTIVLKRSQSPLDEVQIIAYGQTSRRLATGNTSTVKADVIEKQPVSNPLAALIGRVPGLVVTQQSGVPGSSFSIQIRGRNSIAQGSQPLILIDGIPFAAGNENIQLLNSSITDFNQGSGVSPFNTLSPSDIESIDILKDADATAIYGSRGANGVLLITTKKGRVGKTVVSANFNQGITRVGKLIPLMNTSQYIEMRKEAFINAGMVPNTSNAVDLTIFDQSRYTDYQKEFLGGTGHVSNGNLSISGGSVNTQFLLSGTYYKETSIFPGDLPNQRASFLTNINHRSTDSKLSINFSGSFTNVENRAASKDLTYYTFLSPNTPEFFDADGKLQWVYNGVVFENPYAFLREQYRIRTNNIAGNLNMSYRILNGLSAKILAGYNQQFTNEQNLSPADAKSPNLTVQGHTASFGRNQFVSWNIEPQLEYTSNIWIGKLSVLAGATFLSRTNNSLSINATGFGSESLMESLDAATAIEAASAQTKYKYQAIFGRINYNISDKYIVNITGRRDGSSRFGPGKKFSNFGAAGAAWVFTTEKFASKYLKFLSFGKIRTSYGVTGNDQIGDYQFVQTWRPGFNSYVGAPTLVPNNLFNANYAWERNAKWEAGIDLGFLNDRISFSASYYQNRSGNQLVSYRLPYTTGFSNVIRNFPAIVENKGWEFLLTATPIKSKKLNWNSSFNLTLPKNVLVEFPDIASSSYRTTYRVGRSLNSIVNYQSLGVNRQTGQLTYLDVNGNNAVDVNDFQYNGNRDPEFYGGWQNTFSFGGFELQCFIDFKKQIGRSINYYLYGISGITAGTKQNQPILLNSRWRKPGDITDLPIISAAPPGTSANNASQSSFAYSDQSFIRLRNISIGYSLGSKQLSFIKAKSLRFYLQAQNVMTWNKTKGYDPETQNFIILPALQSYSAGIQITY